jgi:Domain of unknown function (DUF1906)
MNSSPADIVSAATPGAQGFDSDAALTAASAGALYDAGFRFAVRYLSRTSPQNPGDLDAGEMVAILASGLALMAVQHCPRAGWVPSAALGGEYGSAAAANAADIGMLPGVSLWLDLEGVASYATASDTIAYCNSWAAAVAAPGFLPANQPLSGDDLYWRLRVTRYWRSASAVPDVPYRGFCMAQALAPSPVDGISIDRDVIMPDIFGGVPMWLAPAGN